MADRQSPAPTGQSTAPKPTSIATQLPGSQAPFPSLVPGGVFSPNTEKQVSDLLAEMQQYATTAAPGTTTTMQFSYQKSKHTTEKTGQEPQVVESSQVQKSVHQTPPPEQKPEAAQVEQGQAHGTSIFSQIPQFLQEKLGFGGGAAPQPQEQQQQLQQHQGHTEVSYQHSKKTTSTTTTSTSGGEQYPFEYVSAPAHHQPQQQQQQPQPQPQPHEPEQPANQEGGFFAPLKSAAETIKEQVAHIPQMLQETFGHHQETEAEHEKQVQISSYQHSTKTTTTTSTSTSGDHQPHVTHQQQAPAHEEPSLVTPLKTAANKVVEGFEHMVDQASKVFPHAQAPAPGNVQIEMSKHASRQVLTQSGEQPPHIETTSSGYSHVIHGIFDGVPVNGGVVPVIVPLSIKKSTDVTDSAASHRHETPVGYAPQPQAVPQATAQPSAGGATTGTTTIDASSQLEEQLKKMGLTTGHPVSELLQQHLSQHQRAKTPESNIEIAYSAQRTHSSRTVTYETTGSDPKAAQEALQQLQGNLSVVAPPSHPTPEPPASASKQSEYEEGSHVDEDGNLVITKKVTRVTTTTRTIYDESGQPTVETKQATQTTENAGNQPPPQEPSSKMQGKQTRGFGGGRGLDDDSQYQCCCGRMSAQSGAQWVGLIHVICCILAIISLVVAYLTLWERNYGLQLLASVGSLSVGIVVCLGLIALVICMILGLRGGVPVLILPHLLAQFFILIGLLFVFIVSVITLAGTVSAVFGPDRYSTSFVYINDELLHLSEALSASTLILSLLGFFVECWFISIVGAAYRYYSEEAKYRG